jgi:hypothetical protein
MFNCKSFLFKLTPKRNALLKEKYHSCLKNFADNYYALKVKKWMGTNVGEIYTKELFAATFSTIPLPPKKPRPRGLYGTIPMPSSLHAQKHQDIISCFWIR